MITNRQSHLTTKHDLAKNWRDKSIKELIAHLLEHYHVGLRKDITHIKKLLSTCEDCNASDQKTMASLKRFFETLSNELLEHITFEEQNDIPLMLACEKGEMPAGVSEMLERFQVNHDEIGEELLGRQFGVLESLLPINDTHQMLEILNRIRKISDDLTEHVFLEKQVLLPKVLELLNTDKTTRRLSKFIDNRLSM